MAVNPRLAREFRIGPDGLISAAAPWPARPAFGWFALRRAAWRARAGCRDVGTEVFFADTPAADQAAKRACRACEVRAECLAYALAAGELYGIWGGLTPAERRRLNRLRAGRRRARSTTRQREARR